VRIRRLLLLAAAACVSALTLSSAGAAVDDPEWIEGRLGPNYHIVCVDPNTADANACPNGEAFYHESGVSSVDEYSGGVLGFYAKVCYDLDASDGLKCDGRRVTWAAGRGRP